MGKKSTLKYLPIGYQDFKSIIEGGFLYIDKTQDVYNLIQKPYGVYFLSRPRRFGKSLLISTIEQIFLGNKELFKNLWIYNSDYNWEKYPIIKVDIGEASSKNLSTFTIKLNFLLDNIAEGYGIKLKPTLPELKFKELIFKLYKQTGQKVVVLVDEYDKPILDNIDNSEIAEEIRDFLKTFYTTIKSNDSYLRFIFITGVSKFSRVTVFSGLNNLQDISMNEKYATITGITQMELEEYFKEYITELSLDAKLSLKQTLRKIKAWYNGYRFSTKDVRVYNPFSTLHLFENFRFNNYWFVSGTPSFLLNLLKKRDYRVDDIIGRESSKVKFDTYEITNLDVVPLLFQTGYLTIKQVIKPKYGEASFILDYPNNEVAISFTSHLLDKITHNSTGDTVLFLNKLIKSLDRQEIEKFFDILKALFANIPYDLEMDKEKHFQVAFYTLFLLLGMYISVEVRTNDGRIDAVIQTSKQVYIIEIKLDGTAADALEQIKSKEYAIKYSQTSKQVILLGINFNTFTRTVNEYKTEVYKT